MAFEQFFTKQKIAKTRQTPCLILFAEELHLNFKTNGSVFIEHSYNKT